METNTKCCAKCKQIKPIQDFHKASHTRDKRQSYCRQCACETTLARQKNKRNEWNEYLRNYVRNRYENDMNFRLAKMLRARLGYVLRSVGTSKSENTFDLIGCSLADFMAYIESKWLKGMTWDNHGEWHIDHIVPISSFNLVDPVEQRRCFHYTNCQPLWAHDNLAKGNRQTTKIRSKKTQKHGKEKS